MHRFLTFLLLLIPKRFNEDEQLAWVPDMVNRESIIREHLKIDTTKAKRNLTSMAFISSDYPRGFRLARKTAARLDIVSPIWFNLDIFLNTHLRPAYPKIEGEDKVNHDIIESLRSANPNILILPRFSFRHLAGETLEIVVNDETYGFKAGRKIAECCQKYGFDGATIEFSAAITVIAGGFSDLRLNMFEMIAQIGKVLKKYKLKTVFTLPPPVSPFYNMDEEVQYVSGVKESECNMIAQSFDYVHLETYTVYSDKGFRHDFGRVRRCAQVCGYASNLLIGINFYGVKYPLKEYREKTIKEWWAADKVDGKQYMELLKDSSARLEFHAQSMEHYLIVESKNLIVFYPSMTSLEYRIQYAQQLKAGVAIWDYGQGLDYFGNLI